MASVCRYSRETDYAKTMLDQGHYTFAIKSHKCTTTNQREIKCRKRWRNTCLTGSTDWLYSLGIWRMHANATRSCVRLCWGGEFSRFFICHLSYAYTANRIFRWAISTRFTPISLIWRIQMSRFLFRTNRSARIQTEWPRAAVFHFFRTPIRLLMWWIALRAHQTPKFPPCLSSHTIPTTNCYLAAVVYLPCFQHGNLMVIFYTHWLHVAWHSERCGWKWNFISTSEKAAQQSNKF